jgi:hypothetical protein
MKKELQQTLNWDIKIESVLSQNNSFNTRKKALIRNDNNNLLGIVGDNYEPVTNSQLLHLTDALTKSGEFELKGFDEINNGKIILAFLKNNNPDLKMNGCKIEEYMFIGNSFDGTKRFHIGTTSNLIRCANQFSSTLEVYSKKHNSNLIIDDLSIKNLIKSYKETKTELYESFNGLEKIKIDETIIENLIKEVQIMLNYDSRITDKNEQKERLSMLTLRNSIDREIKDLGHNAFALFNGVTWYTTHEMRTKNLLHSQINGSANLINQKAYRFCINLKSKINHSK